MATTKDVYLVVGGSGFLGRHIVEALVARGDVVSVFDVVQRYHDVQFFSGDITDEDSVAQAIHKVLHLYAAISRSRLTDLAFRVVRHASYILRRRATTRRTSRSTSVSMLTVQRL